jgi:uncharacterized membrane protein
MIKEGLESLGWFVIGLVVILLVSILHSLRIIKVDEEYGF